jgi:hypothetical protein
MGGGTRDGGARWKGITLPKAPMKKLSAYLFAVLFVAGTARAGIDMQTGTALVATTTSALGIAQNASRKSIIIQNRSAVKVYFKFDSAIGTVTPPNDALEIASLGNYSESCTAPTDSIYIKSDSSTALVMIYEGIGDCNP